MALRRCLVATVVVLSLALPSSIIGAPQAALPSALSTSELWSLIERLSEPDGYFRSRSGSTDNLLSNEGNLSTVAALLAARVQPAGIYLGVGPEQNFTYIAATRPRMAFITDIRRGNLQLHLLYKALFETSTNRDDFVAKLFGRERPAGLAPTVRAADLMRAYLGARPLDETAFAAAVKSVTSYLTTTRRLPLDAEDREGIEYVYRSFYRFGPAIGYTSTAGRPFFGNNYATLMSSTDAASGTERGFLASEESFAVVKMLESRNLIIPIVGNFAGAKALRGLGVYLREHGAAIAAFYVSNVESYLEQNNTWEAFCANVATMPVSDGAVFIRPGMPLPRILGPVAPETKTCR